MAVASVGIAGQGVRASIITPAFNAAPFIEQCVRNVASQGEAVGEHIIVDGGSTDGTPEMVRVLMTTHPRLHLIPGPDDGQSDAMNKGTLAAKEEVIGFLNADDYYQPGAVAEALAELKKFPGPGIVVGDCRIIDENDAVIRWNRPKDLRVQSLLQSSLWQLLPANPSAYFYHRSVHDLIGGYDTSNHYSMDVDFILGAVRLAQARYVPRHWGNFRLIPGCKSYENAGSDEGRNPLSDVFSRHRRALTPAQKLSMPLFDLHTRLRRLNYLFKKRMGRIR